nr:MAG TPA: hypothetical protein [Caudoviricetes sp.]
MSRDYIDFVVNIIEDLKKRKGKYIAFFLKCWR